jgi:hypothetical protein
METYPLSHIYVVDTTLVVSYPLYLNDSIILLIILQVWLIIFRIYYVLTIHINIMDLRILGCLQLNLYVTFDNMTFSNLLVFY